MDPPHGLLFFCTITSNHNLLQANNHETRTPDSPGSHYKVIGAFRDNASGGNRSSDDIIAFSATISRQTTLRHCRRTPELAVHESAFVRIIK